MRQLRARLGEREISLEISDEAMDLIATAGFDPVYGARPLKRTIQQRLENPLAEAILSGTFGPEDTVTVEVVDGELSFAGAAVA